MKSWLPQTVLLMESMIIINVYVYKIKYMKIYGWMKCLCIYIYRDTGEFLNKYWIYDIYQQRRWSNGNCL